MFSSQCELALAAAFALDIDALAASLDAEKQSI
jgi:hypothetical protein